MKDYDFNTFDGWFIGPIGEFILGITTPGIKIFDVTKNCNGHTTGLM